MKVETLKNWLGERKFWEKGVVVGIIFYLILGLPFSFTIWNEYSGLKEVFEIVLGFLIVVFGMFGFGFRLSERFNTYTKRGAFIGGYIPLIPIFVSIILGTTRCVTFCEGYAFPILGLLIFMPILSVIGAFIGYLYTKVWRD